MGSYAPGSADQASQVLTGNFTATGRSASNAFYGDFNVAIWGTFSGTVEIDRSFDGGTTWVPTATTATGAQYTASGSFALVEPELGVLYSVNCTAFTSGTINYRISQSMPRTGETRW